MNNRLTKCVSPAVASDGTIVIGTNGHTEIALNADGTERCHNQRNSQSYSSPAITAEGLAWFGNHRGYLKGVHSCPALSADGTLLIGATNGMRYAIRD